jgi:hypothetical protein
MITMPFEPEKAPQQEMPGIARGAATKLLYATFGANMVPGDAALLPGATALFLAQNYPNPTPKAAADSQKVLDLLDNIRIQLSKTNPTSP